MSAALELDSVIESFERQRAHSRSVRLRDFLPANDSAEFSAVLLPLRKLTTCEAKGAESGSIVVLAGVDHFG